MTAQLDTTTAAYSEGGQPLTQQSESLWMDAFRRLLRNRAAVLGGSIIIVIMLSAIFAGVISPRTYDEQVLNERDAVPTWDPPTSVRSLSPGSPPGFAPHRHDRGSREGIRRVSILPLPRHPDQKCLWRGSGASFGFLSSVNCPAGD